MSVRLYMDVHVPRPITLGLRRRGVEVLTAQEDGTARLTDPELLDRATELKCVLFSRDDDLLAEASARQRRGDEFGGVIYAHQLRVGVRQAIDDLELTARASSVEELANRVVFLPLL